MHNDQTRVARTLAPERGAVAIISNSRAELLLHLRDDVPDIAWPGYWSLLGGGCDGNEHEVDAIQRELNEEAGLGDQVDSLRRVCELRDELGSGQLITFFSAHWDGDETQLPLTEGVKLQFFAPEFLDGLKIPFFIRDGINRYLDTVKPLRTRRRPR
ncbi:NUDIX domain-containing protein [Streptomyces sp. NPDC058471]|uniref:NUDIX domain-containing protein n=1 Tax=Streptomyces sp. NPDC058471 TaxID=3346516 RepID=UPI003659CA51